MTPASEEKSRKASKKAQLPVAWVRRRPVLVPVAFDAGPGMVFVLGEHLRAPCVVLSGRVQGARAVTRGTIQSTEQSVNQHLKGKGQRAFCCAGSPRSSSMCP